ncbi:hypothetical protein JJV70_10095 [Streptomyces sp. JJ66]|uniref:hypothetical protein n=1 Tax=Streptomyces sp. JJ66 TaxID=2803843 RepID=UPI001C575D78|nr:hypothetical protein [Streptomyces sp. JJ66]MBW1602454.1 hypothetical protein [Streptomyces sp. JJ66]
MEAVSSRNWHTRNFTTGILVVLFSANFATGCGENRQPEEPVSVCGVTMDQNLFPAPLQDGEEFEEAGPGLPSVRDTCLIGIKDKLDAHLTFSPAVNYFHDPAKKKLKNREVVERLPFPGKAAFGDDSAMVIAECAGLLDKYFIVDTRFWETPTEGMVERREYIEEFTVQFTHAAWKKLQCGAEGSLGEETSPAAQ